MKQLFEFQKEAIESVSENKNALLAWQMGTGKTISSIELAKIYGSDILVCLVLKSTVQQWIDELTEQTEMNVFNGYKKTKKNGIIPFIQCSERKALVIGYDAYKTNGCDALRKYICKNSANTTLICDESSLIGHRTSQRTKAVIKTNSEHKIFLSGTPATGGKMENIIPTANMLGWDITYEEFLSRYCYVNHYVDRSNPWRRFDIITGYHDIDDMRENLKTYGTSFLTMEEAGWQLPESQNIIVDTDTIPAYKTFKKKSIVEIDGKEIVGDNALTQMLYERQLCSCIYNKNRTEAIFDLLNEAGDEPVVVFYNWTAELNVLEKICEQLHKQIDYVNGTGRNLRHYDAGDAGTVILCQYQAAAMGLNLQKARICIFASLCLSYSDFDQAQARINRIGQKLNTLFYIPICKGTVEEKIYKTLEERKDYTIQLFTESDAAAA